MDDSLLGGRVAQHPIVIEVEGSRMVSLTRRKVTASLPLESPDNEGLYK